MFATATHLPKWLLAAVVFCVVLGHFEQAGCRLTGCHVAVADACAEGDHPATGETGHCDCPCHSSVAIFEVPPVFAAVRFARPLPVIERPVNAPEVPGAEIEYPPRSVRA